MRRLHLAIGLTLSMGSVAAAQTPSPAVEMEYMTSPEVYSAIHKDGKTTVLVFNGGTEQRGPHGVLGGHTFMARAIAVEIAKKLGNALVAPVLPIGSTGMITPKFPGGIGLPVEVFQQVYEAVVEDLVVSGFKTIVLMGDHGTGQEELHNAAVKMDAVYGPKGTRVIYSEDVYEKSRAVFNEYAQSAMKEGFDPGTHAGLYDTSMLLYLQPAPEAFVRSNYKTVTPNPTPNPGQGAAPNSIENENGVSGDPRYATAELGRKMMEIKVSLAVEEINRKLAEKPAVP